MHMIMELIISCIAQANEDPIQKKKKKKLKIETEVKRPLSKANIGRWIPMCQKAYKKLKKTLHHSTYPFFVESLQTTPMGNGDTS